MSFFNQDPLRDLSASPNKPRRRRTLSPRVALYGGATAAVVAAPFVAQLPPKALLAASLACVALLCLAIIYATRGES